MSRDHITGIKYLNDAMICKLKENSYKECWLELDEIEIIGKLLEEYLELVEALRRKTSDADIINEAADLANVCMFIIHRIKNGKRIS